MRKTPATAETDFAGTVVSVGPDVKKVASGEDCDRNFQPGDEVFGSFPVGDHLKTGRGALAEYLAIDASAIARRPQNISAAEAASLPVSGVTAVALLDRAALKPGQKVLVNGCCGGIGSYATQLAKAAVGNSGKLVGICSSTNFSTAKQLGCDETFDYHDTTDGKTLNQVLAEKYGADNGFDCIIDCHGSQDIWHGCPKFLKPKDKDGVYGYVTVGPKYSSMSAFGVLSILPSMFLNSMTPTWLGGVPRPYWPITGFVNTAALERLKKLAETGEIKPELGGQFEFEDALDAYKAALSGHGTGKTIVKISS
jgi:NADPH:quinone reductase-like Zn-dependent oxidoreductase